MIALTFGVNEVDIVFGSAKIRKKCKNPQGKLKRRLDDIRAAESMAVLMKLPGRCHPLGDNRKGQWAMDLEHPLRFIFKPILDEAENNQDRLQLDKISAIEVIGIEDYHGK